MIAFNGLNSNKNSLYKIVQKIEIYFKYINMLRLI